MDTPQVAGLMESVGAGLQKFVNPISKFLAYIAALLALLMALIIGIDIVLRIFFQRPMTGVIELETFLLAVMCFFSLAHTMIMGGHVSVDLLKNRFSDRCQELMAALFAVLGIFIFALIGWQYVGKTIEALHISENSEILSWPMWPLFLTTALGSTLMVLVMVADLLHHQARLLEIFANPKRAVILVYAIATAVILTPLGLKLLSPDLGPALIGVFMIAMMLILLFVGFPVAFTMILVGLLGTWYITGLDIALGVMKMAVYDSVANYFFCVVPFFVLMGFFCLNAGISKKLYDASYKWFGQMPGGLAIATIFGCGGFAAISGDSMATAATMGSVAIPEMKKYNYDDSLATGSVAAGGTLGILIPPSLGFIVYGIVTEESVGKLFMAGIMPGILLTLLFALAVYLQCRFNPNLGPKAPETPLRDKFAALRNIWPVLLLFALVIGGIYRGFFTPTEAGGVGVLGAFVIAMASREFGKAKFFESLLSSVQITAMVAGILIGVAIMGYFITLTGIPMQLSAFLSGLHVSRYVTFTLILFLYLILGMLMNIIPMIMLTLPIIFPTILALGFDPIWFGVIMVIMMEMGQISPPVGINVFVIAGVAGVPMGKIFRGVLPFVIVEVLVIIILTVFPKIVMFLPDAMDMLAPISY